VCVYVCVCVCVCVCACRPQDVQPNSPAARAGLQSHEDYVIASPDTLLHDAGAFAEQVAQSLARPMRLYVYNRAADVIREVTVIPDRDWGGAGRCAKDKVRERERERCMCVCMYVHVCACVCARALCM
jgi:hypothetical protein